MKVTKAKTVSFLNLEDMTNTYYGIELQTPDGKLYAMQNGKAVISQNKSEIIAKVRQLNKQFAQENDAEEQRNFERRLNTAMSKALLKTITSH